MRIGQVLLATEATDTADHLVELVCALSRHSVHQHVLVGDEQVARRFAAIDRVTIGPLVRTPVMACCLMPDVDIAHTHDQKSGQTGLLLTLTRSVPFVVTLPARTTHISAAASPIIRAVYRRARCIVCQSDDDTDSVRSRYPDALIEHIPPIELRDSCVGAGVINPERAAAQYMKVYRRTIDSGRLPAMML